VKSIALSGCALFLVLSLIPAPAQTDPSLREDGVLYFEGNLPNKLTVPLRAMTTVYTRRDFQMALGYLSPGQNLELVGMSPEGYIVKGNYRNNSVVGWIHPADLPPGIDPAVFAEAKKNQERRDAVAVAIANKSVIQGMTPDEVKQSLGRPTATSSRVDASGTIQTWTFTTYREEPQYSYALDAYGRSVLQTYYVKIPIGQLIIDFANGAVTAVEEHKLDPNTPGVVTN
jgi:hypothetical protein